MTYNYPEVVKMRERMPDLSQDVKDALRIIERARWSGALTESADRTLCHAWRYLANPQDSYIQTGR